MDWLQSLFFSTDSVAHIVLLYALVISVGIGLGRIKVGGVSLGVTFVLFAGIVAGHFGFTGTYNVLTFVQDFGLILFVYCIGLQVGPGFFESFKKGGVQLNLMAMSIILLNVLCCIGLYFLVFYDGDASATDNSRNLAMMVGVLCGAVTNTPGLGAATEACNQIFGASAPAITNGYACAYPLGVVGIIGAIIAIRFLCNISMKDEQKRMEKEQAANLHVVPHRMTLAVQNAYLSGKTILQIRQFLGRDFVCSRILQDGHVSIPTRDTVIAEGNKMFITCAKDDAEAVRAFIGPEEDVVWEEQDVPMVSKHILVTQPSMNGKTFGQMHFSSVHGVNVTRIRRGDMNLFADHSLRMQIGDRIVVVGPEDAVDRVARVMGNSVKKLEHPNLSAIFIGIFVGIIFGAIPIALPGIPTPVKLGLAGGPLIVAILIGRFGYRAKLVAYTTTSANLMLREIGLALFLASVGIKAGASFVNTVVAGDGLTYVWCGFLITVLPILIVGLIARLCYKTNYFTLMGLIAGSNTDPPALAFANQSTTSDAPAVGYSTVYPLSMFLRILTAQLIILLLCFV
ncbi:MAG: putative transporter [Bacteroidaceae bacterium]|nr:putative transporter [Bacteroidaceae bacterium]MBO7167908.1 putative transporter [Bacteroidaceae bacterium]MBQ2300665.1 putative transporter [Bacteroidaceae bacterium]MBQ5713575.1 putative transporter [Bacteroidaceae bacterium]MBQ5871134.1 putative transporter [Bacteroidaceae bacterium]